MIQAKPGAGRECCPQRGPGFGHSQRGSILKGLQHSAQGCEPRATLGVRRVGANNPEKVASFDRGAMPGGDATLTGLGVAFGAFTQGSFAAPGPRTLDIGLWTLDLSQ
jgi:hypothetical protein